MHLGAVLVALLSLAGCTPSSSSPNPPSPASSDHATSSTPSTATPPQVATDHKEPAVQTVTRTDEEWKKILTPEQYRVLRQKGTERAFTGKYESTKTKGVYKCAACGAVLFTSDAKFDSGCGWPSFFTPLAKDAVIETVDDSFGMKRTEITCASCGGHLGHVFDDAPNQPTGLRYCINSVSIELVPAEDAAPRDKPSTPGK
jgi:peptide-methionine (R)-S-oxide reductase